MPNWRSYDSSVRLLSAILAAHPELRLNYQEISKRYGGDCTVSALENRFRRIKGDAKALNDALEKGIDPITIPTDSLNGKISGGKGIADKFGNNGASNGNGKGAAPAKPKAAPRKKMAAAATGSDNEDDDEEFDERKPTPKKSTLNKTQGGRVSKPQTPRKNGSFNANVSAITVPSDNEEDIIKREHAGNGFHSNGNGNGYGRSFAMDDDAGDDDGAQYYEANGYASDENVV